jgi:hypothetical protein
MPSGVVNRYRHFGWRRCLRFFLLCRSWRWRQHAFPKLQYLCINAKSYIRISISTAVIASNSLRISVYLWRATTQFIKGICQLWILIKYRYFVHWLCMDELLFLEGSAELCVSDCSTDNSDYRFRCPLTSKVLRIDKSVSETYWHQQTMGCYLSFPQIARPIFLGITRTQFVSCEVWGSHSISAEDPNLLGCYALSICK